MNYIEKAKEDAVIAGWQRQKGKWHDDALAFVDPAFWQALGRAWGWQSEKLRMCGGCGLHLRSNEQETMDGKHKKCGSDIDEYEGQWLMEWHCFIDHLADGKSPERAFEFRYSGLLEDGQRTQTTTDSAPSQII